MSKIYISKLANKILINYLKCKGYEIIYINNNDTVYNAISCHPDIFMCQLGATNDSEVFFGDISTLGKNYPNNIRYNAVCLKNYFIHNLKHTGEDLLSAISKSPQELINIHVSQGYTKCNTVVVDDTSIITSDKGIANTLKDYPINILLIAPGSVKLPPFRYGFLGGASGRVGDEIIFNGDLSKHPDFEKICSFIALRNLQVKYFQEYELEDIGSIIATTYNITY